MKKDNNKIKKIGAWIAIIILLLACCMPMIFAFGNGEDSQVYFKASLAVAIMVPIMAYAIWMVYKLSLIHISEPTRHSIVSRMPSSA